MLYKLPKETAKKSKRIGRGVGSGKGGHTVGRGQKGQKSRRKVHVLFEGFKVKKSFYKRLPFARGKGKLKPKEKPVVVSLSDLELMSNEKEINVDTLIKNKIVRKSQAIKRGVKILANGSITKKVTVALPVSASAKKKIEEAGGVVLEAKS
ncbi:MAG: 50S ribosomal protein L15 [Patescibacteria group bacterium]|nr:50S ribosomal protein L15 [Patescibacteria group bacterium]